jgi:hypothetical protein
VLEQHLDAFAMLASTDAIGASIPIRGSGRWLRHFTDAMSEVYADKSQATIPLHFHFITFLWVTRSTTMALTPIDKIFQKYPDAAFEMRVALTFPSGNRKCGWLPTDLPGIVRIIHHATQDQYTFMRQSNCCMCKRLVRYPAEPKFFNPLPSVPPIASGNPNAPIGSVMTCQECVANNLKIRFWPWRIYRGITRPEDQFEVEAWAWTDQE